MRRVVSSLIVIFLKIALLSSAQAAPPVINTQPSNSTNVVGDVVVFEVDAVGDNDVTFQWRKNGGNLPDNGRYLGINESALFIDGVVASDTGNFSVLVRDSVSGQTTTSANAYLRVLTPPTISAGGQPISKNVVAGGSVTFTVTPSGTAPFSYQWFGDGFPLPDATNASLTLSNVQPSDEGDYAVVVGNEAVNYGAESAISEPATLTVLIPPTITDQPESVVAEQHDSVTFSVDINPDATEPVTYQWRLNGGTLADKTDSLLEVLDVQPDDAGAYSVVVANAAGSVTSANAVLTVNTPPVFTLHPANRTVTAGNSWTFTAKATGTAPLTYQWRFNDSPIAGATKTAYTVFVSSTDQTGDYSVVASNLVDAVESNPAHLTAVAETVKPTVAITTPVNGARWSNSIITIHGTAADNAKVVNVEYEFNGGDVVNATTTNGWTNWTGTFPAIAGTNQVRAVATDSSNNRSVSTLMRKIFYVVPSPLTLLTNGLGTITLNPAVPSKVLEIGRDYTATATAAAGSGFVAWDGGISSTNPILKFRMSSNLVLRANFRDNTKPTVTITSPPLNARLSNSVATFQGTARDNFALDHVEYQLNDGPIEFATGTSNWSATVNLTAGTNIFRVASVDTTANGSLVASRSVFFAVPSPLNLVTNGRGGITGVANGQMLEVGRAYKATATPAFRNIFAEWSGGVVSTNPALTFLMQSNLTLQANFVTNPFVGLKGAYYGLFYETNETRNHDRSGSFTFTLAEAGTYSASFQLGAKKLSATGKFDWLGRSWLTLKPLPASNVIVAMQLDVTNLTDKVNGSTSNQFWWAPLFGFRAPVFAKTNISSRAGKYTAAFLHTAEDASAPNGDGFGSIIVSTKSVAQFSGMMADGSPVTQSVPVSEDGLWPFYVSLYSGKGSALGWGLFTNRETSSIEGADGGMVSWIRPPIVGKYYPSGFNTNVAILGSHYAQPPKGVRVIEVTNGEVEFTGGTLTGPLTNGVFLTTNNTVTVTSGTNKLALTFTLTTGKAAGTFIHPVTKLSAKINGVLLPEDNTMRGFFLSTNKSGSVILRSVSP